MYDILIPSLAFLSTVTIGAAVLIVRAARVKPIEDRIRAMDALATVRVQSSPWVERLLGRLGRVVASEGASRTLREQMARAGFHGETAPMVYLGAKILLAAAGLGGTALLVMRADLAPGFKTSIMMIGAGVPFFLPNVFLSSRRRRRRMKLCLALPDAVDLLEICVTAGMGLDMAWNVVTDDIRRVSPTLADEMALTNLEIHLGAPRVEAMRHLCERTGVEQIGSLVAVLVQSERFGTSVRDALRSFTVTMRETRSSTAEEAAERMSVRLLFPMVLFVFPVIFIVTVGPAALTLIDLFSRR